tara:strand:+ start:1102 stop:2646 length:1545 start_codon:yes stop_codon:yes gene_type:complete
MKKFILLLIIPLISFGQFEIGNEYGGGIIFSIDEEQGLVLIADLSDLSESSSGDDAVSICESSSNSGYNDWYLPTNDNLISMYYNIGQGSNNIGNFSDWGNYWSSTGCGGGTTYYLMFTSGGSPAELCTSSCCNNFRVRAIREIQIIGGCTDQLACNYVVDANLDDGSCVFPLQTNIIETVCDSLSWNGLTYFESGTYYKNLSDNDQYQDFLDNNSYPEDSLYQFINTFSNIDWSNENNILINENSGELWGRYYEDFSDGIAQGNWSWVSTNGADGLNANPSGGLNENQLANGTYYVSSCCDNGTRTVQVTSPIYSASPGYEIISVSYSGGASASSCSNCPLSTSNSIRINGQWQEYYSDFVVPPGTTSVQFRWFSQATWNASVSVDNIEIIASNSLLGLPFPPVFPNDECFYQTQILDLTVNNCGCIDNSACNYNESANTDDGSCVFPPEIYFNCDGSVNLDLLISLVQSYENEINSFDCSENITPADTDQQINLEDLFWILDNWHDVWPSTE